MMMSKPKAEATSSSSTTATSVSPATTTTTTSNPTDAVADLERRLAELSAATPIIPASTTATTTATASTSTGRQSAPTAPSTSAGSSSKNALLARIIAAQERAKQAQPVAAPTPSTTAPMAPPAFDLLAAASNEQLPPPSFNAMPPTFESMMGNTGTLRPENIFSPPPTMPTAVPPPAFNDAFFSQPPVVHQQPPPPVFDSSFLPPPSYDHNNTASSTQFASMHASAPSFEDLMMEPAHPTALLPPPVPPPSMSTTTGGLDDEAIQAILAIEGLSQADKDELINEQLKIMKSIEGSKKSAQVSAADAFEQRSFSAAVQSVGGGSKRNTTSSSSSVLGMERTQQAIADGTAVVVQCTACGEWMQVTGAAQFMMCSSCNTMTQVQEAGITSEEAQQMIADAKLAEQLQKEEYEEADRAAASSARSSPSRPKASSSSTTNAAKTATSGTWMEWLGFGTPAPAPATRASNDLQLSYSRDSADDAANGLLGESSSSQRRQAARVVAQQPLFACVTDSISSAANYAINSAQGLHEDEEGNVHGVDSTSLLAVTQVGRGSSNQNYEQMPGGSGSQ